MTCATSTHYTLRKLALGATTRLTVHSLDRSLSSALPQPQRVSVSINNHIAHVKLNRPDKLNALDMDMFQSIVTTASSLSSSTRAVILSGEGRAFSTGLDVRSVFWPNPVQAAEQLLQRTHKKTNLAQQVAMAWRELNVPVICVVHGMCYGGGLQIALGADIRIATADCKLSIMETKWGLIPDMSASVSLRELLRIDVAKELTMTGRIVTGTEAKEIGLVTHVLDTQEKAMAKAQELAQEIVQRSPDAVALSKRLYQETWATMPEEECLKLETKYQRKLLVSWNQLAASGRNFGVNLPYSKVKDDDDKNSATT